MALFKINRDEHRIQDTDFVRHLRTRLNDPDLFTAYNNKTNTWFLGYWVNKDKGTANDVDDLGPNMEHATADLVRQLERSRKGYTKEDLQKRLIKRDRDAYYKEQAECEERQKFATWLQKKSGSNVPVLMG